MAASGLEQEGRGYFQSRCQKWLAQWLWWRWGGVQHNMEVGAGRHHNERHASDVDVPGACLGSEALCGVRCTQSTLSSAFSPVTDAVALPPEARNSCAASIGNRERGAARPVSICLNQPRIIRACRERAISGMCVSFGAAVRLCYG
jgi:hypothetical protein